MNNQDQNLGNHNVQSQQMENQGRTVLFVSDLADNINEADLEIFFQDYRQFIILFQINRVNKQSETRPNCNATIIFKDAAKADSARKALNLRKLKGKTIRIMWHERDNSQRYNNQGNIFVKNIPAEVKPRDFFEFFIRFGDIVSAKLCEDDDGNHYGYGYVHYTSDDYANLALDHCINNKVWGVELEVKNFQKKNERQYPMSGNKNVYIKNIPVKTPENEIKQIFSKYGAITWMKIVDEKVGKFAIISYDNEDSVTKAIAAENGRKIDDQELFVDTLMKKADRKKLLNNKINDNNFRLNAKFKNCNLHIRNIPNDAKEDDLAEAFGKFGEIQSVKIQKYTLVTKVNNEFKEVPMSRGFGYVCFTNEDHAKNAKEALNNKPLPKFESCKRPVLIDFFMPRNERQTVFTKLQQQFNPGVQKKLPFLNPIQQPFGMGPMNYSMLGFHPNLAKHVKFPPHNMNMGIRMINNPMVMDMKQPNQMMKPQNHQQSKSKYEEPDVKYMESLEDDMARKDYLGEFIFKKIENHELTQKKQMTIDYIGKITGMILGIDDLHEIVEISKDNQQLTSRIQEAIELLEGVSR